MPFTNFEKIHFSATKKNAVNTAITSLETAVVVKLDNLTQEERQNYGSINEQKKVKDYRENQPIHSSLDTCRINVKFLKNLLLILFLMPFLGISQMKTVSGVLWIRM